MRLPASLRLASPLALLTLMACGGGSDSSKPLAKPAISSFGAPTVLVEAGLTFSLTATYTGTRAVLTPGNVAVTSGTPVTAGPLTRATLYTLTVTGEDGSTATQDLVVGLTRPAQNRLAAGTFHSVALKSDGSVWAWGSNGYGQLGDATTTDNPLPVQVKGIAGTGTLANVGLITATYYQSFALQKDGTLLGWGWGANGELGQGAHASSSTPVKAALDGVVGVAAGGHHTVALKKDGTVWTWGNNTNLQLGYATLPVGEQLTPKQVPGLSGVVAVAAGFFHTLVLKADGSVWSFGQNLYGELGNGTTAGSVGPVQVLGPGGSGTLGGIVALAAGASQNWTSSDPLDYCAHSLALASDGKVYAWGNNAWGQLGQGDTTNRSTPALVGSLSGADAIAAAYGHSMALASGSLYAWGRNGRGSLGDGSTVDRNLPVQVVGPVTGFLGNGVGLAVGGDAGHYTDGTPFDRAHGLAVTADGLVYAWGCNYDGELGQGTRYDHNAHSRPLGVSGLSGF